MFQFPISEYFEILTSLSCTRVWLLNYRISFFDVDYNGKIYTVLKLLENITSDLEQI